MTIATVPLMSKVHLCSAQTELAKLIPKAAISNSWVVLHQLLLSIKRPGLFVEIAIVHIEVEIKVVEVIKVEISVHT